MERTLQVELTPDELDRYWEDLCPDNGPQRVSFDECLGINAAYMQHKQ